MSPSRLVSLVALAVVLLLSGSPLRAQEGVELRAQRQMSAGDAEVFAARLAQLGALLTSGALSQKEMAELKDGLLRSCSTVVISGELNSAPLADALLSIIRLSREQGRGPSLVIRPEDLSALTEVRVSALFSSTRAADAVRALLRSQDAAQTLSLEVTEENDVFVVAVHRWEEDADEADVDERRKQPPADQRPIIELVEEEEVTQVGYLGVGAGPQVTVVPGGVVIGTVDAGGPAATAGLQAGDVLSELDGQAVTTWDELRAQVRAKSAGQNVVLDVVRNGQRRRVIVTLGRAP
jgi:hypothetical protein